MSQPEKTRRQHVLDRVSDLVVNLLYYDRKEDEDLPVGAIEAALEAGEITVAEIIGHFAIEFFTAIEGIEDGTEEPDRG